MIFNFEMYPDISEGQKIDFNLFFVHVYFIEILDCLSFTCLIVQKFRGNLVTFEYIVEVPCQIAPVVAIFGVGVHNFVFVSRLFAIFLTSPAFSCQSQKLDTYQERKHHVGNDLVEIYVHTCSILSHVVEMVHDCPCQYQIVLY